LIIRSLAAKMIEQKVEDKDKKKDKPSYREIIKQNIRAIQGKKTATKDQKLLDRYDYFIGQLIADLRDYETDGKQRWPNEPRDKAWSKYGRKARGFTSFEDIIRRLFDDDFWTM